MQTLTGNPKFKETGVGGAERTYAEPCPGGEVEALNGESLCKGRNVSSTLETGP